MAYSKDLRQKAVSAVEEGHTQESVARMLNIGVASLERWLKRKRETGKIEAISPSGRTRKIDKDGEVLLKEYLQTNPEAELSDMCEYLARKGYERVSNSTMSRLLKLINISRKKDLSSS